MRTWLIGFAASALTLVVLDAVWLGLIARDFYKSQLGSLIKDRPDLVWAVVFYLIHAAGVATFVLSRSADWRDAALFGAFFGLCCYAAYDFTNQAVIKGWPLTVTLVDVCWGTAVTAIAAVAARAVQRAFA
jgi:uncharacterized membrane protein